MSQMCAAECKRVDMYLSVSAEKKAGMDRWWNNEGGGISGTIALAGRADGLLAWEVQLTLSQNNEQEFVLYLAKFH